MTHVVIKRFETWLAELPDRRIVGLLVLQDDWIHQLYVDPDFRGHGIGGQLVGVAKPERPHRLRLWTFVSNRGAQRFYTRLGANQTAKRVSTRTSACRYRWLSGSGSTPSTSGSIKPESYEKR
jgi:GNAT superfamily N-acetyltransferase